MTHTRYQTTGTIVAVSAVAVFLASCELPNRSSQQTDTSAETQQELVRAAGDDLTKALKSTVAALPTDASLLAEFRANHQDYAAVASHVRNDPDLTRFDLSIAPPRYYRFSGKEGPISELDASLRHLLLSGTIPEIVDGDLRLTVAKPELQFVNHRSGTAFAGASKGIAFAPSGVRGPILKNLDESAAVRRSASNVESKCAYRQIEEMWYLFVCI